MLERSLAMYRQGMCVQEVRKEKVEMWRGKRRGLSSRDQTVL